MFFKWLIIFLLCSIPSIKSYSHGSWQQHAVDIRGVLGFEDDQRIDSWIKYISSDMIDNANAFRKKLQNNHHGFTCKHRLLFHWGYDAEPWTIDLEERVKQYCENYDLNVESNIRVFKSEMKEEQKRRNSLINKKTENLFGFAHGGKDASYARFFAAMAYDIHILGDYMSDNSDLDGLQNFNSLINHITNTLQSIDKIEFKKSGIQRQIKQILQKNKQTESSKADNLMMYLKASVPNYIKKVQKGSIYRRLCKRGFKFQETEKSWYQNFFHIFSFTSTADEATGTAKRNRTLSIARARYIAKQFINNGIEKLQMKAFSLGGIREFKPKEANRFAMVVLRE